MKIGIVGKSRYIDADRLVAWCQETGRAQSTVTGKAYVNALLTAVDSCPTADVVEVRHGAWMSAYEYALKIGCTDERRLEEAKADKRWKFCPFCEQQVKWDFNYCPNCGAKMDGERKEK